MDWNNERTIDLTALTAFDVKFRCSNRRLLFPILRALGFTKTAPTCLLIGMPRVISS